MRAYQGRDKYKLYTQGAVKLIMIGVCSFLCASAVFANPVLDNIASGNVTIQQTTTTTTVNQTSQKAIINWQSFNIAKPETTHFQQPAGGVALNRINPRQGASQIYGHLSATGLIILVNPAGIYFGPTAFVNVGGMIASTANISNQDFLNGYYHFTNVPGYNGAIVNEGQLIAANHGLIALVGGAVRNDGMIQANMGHVVLASGEAFTMSFGGDDLISFIIDRGVSKRAVDRNGNEIADGVSNNGEIIANGGHVLISASATSGVLDHVINTQGIVSARSVYKSHGNIIISASPHSGVVRIAGKLRATGKHKGQHGGNITVTGENILLDSTASLDVSGYSGAGNITIGGNAHGAGPLPNANAVVMMPGAKIRADAIESGNGGNVVLWSDYYTNVNGSISARGGSESGHGGNIETSSKNVLSVGDFTVNTSAPHGSAGDWLLDPSDLTISSAANSNVTAASPFSPSSQVSNSFLNVGTLTTALSTGNVTVQTSAGAGPGNGDILIPTATTISWSSAFNLTLSAYRNITASGTAAISNTGGGSVVLQSDNTGTGVGTVAFGTGNVTLSGGSGTVSVYYNPTTFGTQDTIYSGGTAATKYMLIQSLGTGSDSATTRSLGALSNSANTALWNKNYALAKNIDASLTNNGAGWTASGFSPIGSSATNFTGKFDGQNHTISNLFINRGATSTIGFFGQASAAASISNLALTGLSVTGNANVGGLVGINAASLSNVSVTGSVSGAGTQIGGLVGSNTGNVTATVLGNTFVSGTVTGTSVAANNFVGGLIGRATAGSISNVQNFATVSASNYSSVGGIAGSSTVAISNSSNSNNVSGSVNVGGIVGNGNFAGTNLTDVFSTGAISAVNTVGGLAGTLQGSLTGTILGNTYASGSVTSTGSGVSNTGGLVGNAFGSITNVQNFATVTASSAANFVGGIVGKTTGSITTAQNNGNVTGGDSSIGGIAGSNSSSSIFTNVSSTGAISGITQVGGLVGTNFGTITATTLGLTYVTGSVTGSSATAQNYVAGIVGLNKSNATISNVYNAATISSVNNNYNGVGGLAGYSDTGSTISNSYNIGAVTGATSVGGITGVFRGSLMSNVYSNAVITGTSGGNSVGGIAGRNSGSIVDAYNLNTVTGGGSSVGGIVGFADISTSNLTNVFSAGSVSGVIQVGGIAGRNLGGTITATTLGLTYATGSVTGTSTTAQDYVAGIVGLNSGAISNVYNAATISSVNNNYNGVGGLSGYSDVGSTISNSYNIGTVTGATSVGGIAGVFRGTLMSNVYSNAVITGTSGGQAVGGIAGTNSGNISNAYNVNTVTGDTYVGGVVGFTDISTSSLTDVYSTGTINGVTNVGGLAGYNSGSITGTSAGLTYASGAITGSNNVGGAIGWNLGNVNNASFSGTVTGAGVIGVFVAYESAGASLSNTKVSNTTLNGLSGNNYFTLNANQILNNITFNAARNGNNTFDFGGYAGAVVVTMSGTNNGVAVANGTRIATFNNIDTLIGNPSFNNTLIPTTHDYPFLIRTSATSGYFTDPLTYKNFIVPSFVGGFGSQPIGFTFNQAFANPISTINQGTYLSNAVASNVPYLQPGASPQWLIFGNQQFTIINNLERPVMTQTGYMNTNGLGSIMLPVKPFRSLTVQILDEMGKLSAANAETRLF